MHIQDINGVKVITSDYMHFSDVKDIVDNTIQTWQPDRSPAETTMDTIQGKLAESIVEEYFQHFFHDVVYLPYDNIRTDAFKMHAPFDALVFLKDKFNDIQIEKIKKLINDDVLLHGGKKISKNLRKFLRNQGIHTVEVKSTKVSEDKRPLADHVLVERIRYDDFFLYPCQLRKSASVDNFEKYVDFVKNKYPQYFKNLSEQQSISKILNSEYLNSNDIIIRVYTDLPEYKFYLMGYMSNLDILKNKKIKRFYKKNKSENALYFARPIRDGESVDKFLENYFPRQKSDMSFEHNNNIDER